MPPEEKSKETPKNNPFDVSQNNTKKVDEIKKKPIVRTYESDVSNAIKKKKSSMVDIVMAEKNSRKQESKKAIKQERDSKNKIVKIILIFVIIIGVLFLGYGIYSIFSPNEESKKEIEVSDLKEIIFVNERMSLDITGFDKKRLISKVLDIKDELDPTLGTIVNVYPTKEVVANEGENLSTKRIQVESSDFLQNLGIVLPSGLDRSLTGEFMFGFHMTGTVEPFFILKVNSFENSFAGMIRWENNIDNDLEFLINDRIKRSARIHATSTEEVIGLLKDFEDMVIKNRDVRIMKDKNEEDILMYSLPDRKTILITTNKNTLVEILDRLSRAKFSR